MLDISCRVQCTSSFARQPWLMKFHEEEKQTSTFISPINGMREQRNIPEMQGKKCFGCFGEWVLLIDKQTRECFFLSLISYSKVLLPTFPESVESIGNFSISSSSPTMPDCMTTFVSVWDNFILFCHKHDKEWTKVPVGCFPDESPVFNFGVNIIYKGRLFILSNARLAYVFDVASLLDSHIETIPSYALDAYPYARRKDKYLVESCNSLFFIVVHLFGEGQHVTHIEVHRLFDPSEEEEEEEEDQKHDGLCWNYVTNIGDQAFFLSKMHGVSLCAKDFGVEPNCIYVTVSCSDGERLYKFCLGNQTFSFNVLLPEET